MMDCIWADLCTLSIRATMPNGSIWHIPLPYILTKYAKEHHLFKTDGNEALWQAVYDLTGRVTGETYDDGSKCLNEYCAKLSWEEVSKIEGIRNINKDSSVITQQDWVIAKKELKDTSYKNKELGFYYQRCSEYFTLHDGNFTIRRESRRESYSHADKCDKELCQTNKEGKCHVAKNADIRFCIYSPTPFEVSLESWLNDFDVEEFNPVTKIWEEVK